MFDKEIAPLTAAETLAAAAAAHELRARVDVELLELAQHFADLHPDPAMVPGHVSLPGGERGRVYGGPGCPGVAEFAVAEFGAMIGRSAGSAAVLVGQALALRHRLPLSWAQVKGGHGQPWKACTIATACLALSVEAAAIVDRRVAAIIDTVTPVRLERIVKAAVQQADPEVARAAAEAKAKERGVWAGRADDHGTTTVYVRAATGDVIHFKATIRQIADALAHLGDTDTLPQRKAKAIGIIADPALTHELLAVAHHLTPTPDATAPGATSPTPPAAPAPTTPTPEAGATGPSTSASPAAAPVKPSAATATATARPTTPGTTDHSAHHPTNRLTPSAGDDAHRAASAVSLAGEDAHRANRPAPLAGEDTDSTDSSVPPAIEDADSSERPAPLADSDADGADRPVSLAKEDMDRTERLVPFAGGAADSTARPVRRAGVDADSAARPVSLPDEDPDRTPRPVGAAGEAAVAAGGPVSVADEDTDRPGSYADRPAAHLGCGVERAERLRVAGSQGLSRGHGSPAGGGEDRAAGWFVADEPSEHGEADREPPHPSDPVYDRVFCSAGPPDPDSPDDRCTEHPDSPPGGGPGMDGAARREVARKLAAIKQGAYSNHSAGVPGWKPARTTLYVHITDQTLLAGGGVARVERFGPVFAARLEELLGHDQIVVKPVIDLNDRLSVDAYEVPRRIRERVKLTHPVEQFVFGAAETTDSVDLDHIAPFDFSPTGPPGQTSTDNLTPLRRYSHRVKTHGGWRVHRLNDGALEWTTKHGFKFRVDHTGTHPLTDPASLPLADH